MTIRPKIKNCRPIVHCELLQDRYSGPSTGSCGGSRRSGGIIGLARPGRPSIRCGLVAHGRSALRSERTVRGCACASLAGKNAKAPATSIRSCAASVVSGCRCFCWPAPSWLGLSWPEPGSLEMGEPAYALCIVPVWFGFGWNRNGPRVQVVVTAAAAAAVAGLGSRRLGLRRRGPNRRNELRARQRCARALGICECVREE